MPAEHPSRSGGLSSCARRIGAAWFIVAGALLFAAPAARATIVGLNQIVTPDIQPTGVLALSAQVQHPLIGNSEMVQFELGVTPRFEVAWFQDFKPGAQACFFDRAEDALDFVDRELHSGDLVLVKGSRSVRMEKIVKHLRETRSILNE